LRNLIAQLSNSAEQIPTVAKAVVAASTVGTGTATAIEWIPVVGGIVATSAGIMLSSVLIYTTLKQHKLKLEILHQELANKKNRRKDD